MAGREKDVHGVVVRNILSLVIFVIGLSQMAGFVLNLRAVRAIGAAIVIAPFPKVFSDVDGVETFASKFILEYTSAMRVEKSASWKSRPRFMGGSAVLTTGETFTGLHFPTDQHQSFQNGFSTLFLITV